MGVEPASSPWPGRLIPDSSLESFRGGRVLIGGTPFTVERFDEPVNLTAPIAPEVIDRLVDTGLVHPVPASGPFTPADVTVVIPVHDDPTGLAQSLAGLTRTAPTPAEILVVDDCSSNSVSVTKTVDRVAGPNVRLVHRPVCGGPGAARNTGTETVTTALVAYLDAGCVPQPGWLETLLPHFADPRVALVAPRVLADPDRWQDRPRDTSSSGSRPRFRHNLDQDGRSRIQGRRVWASERLTTLISRHARRSLARYEAVRSALDQGPEPARITPRSRVSFVPGACLVVRRDEIDRVGGFDESLRFGEDVDLVWRLGECRRLRYVPSALVTHDIRVRPLAWAKRRHSYGTSVAPLALRHDPGPDPVSISAWSAAAWAAVGFGHPLGGCAVVAMSSTMFARKLADLERPLRVAARLSVRGNLSAVGPLSTAIRRTWWPLAILVALSGPRPLRRGLLAAFTIPPLVAWRRDFGLDPVTWLIVWLADDLSYGAGVWAGCLHARTTLPMWPDLSAGRIGRGPTRHRRRSTNV